MWGLSNCFHQHMTKAYHDHIKLKLRKSRYGKEFFSFYQDIGKDSGAGQKVSSLELP